MENRPNESTEEEDSSDRKYLQVPFLVKKFKILKFKNQKMIARYHKLLITKTTHSKITVVFYLSR